MLTVDMVEKAFPATLKKNATQSLCDMINNIVADPLIAEQVRNNFISFTGVLKDGKYKTEDYVHAITYVSFKLMGDTNQEAWFKTFPQKYQALVAAGKKSNEISAYVSGYASGKLVNAIMDQAAVPVWLLNRDVYQKAINTQADLMMNAQSEKVRSDAANSILTHLAKPAEKAGALINIDLRENSGMTELKNSIEQLAQQQQQLIAAGARTKDIAAIDIIPRVVEKTR